MADHVWPDAGAVRYPYASPTTTLSGAPPKPRDRASQLVDRAVHDVLGPEGRLTPEQQKVCDMILAIDTHAIHGGGPGFGKSTIRKVVIRALKLAEAEDRGVKLPPLPQH